MTAVETETGIESIEALDFEPEHICQRFDNCGARGVWWLIHPCCSAHFPTCDKCRARYLADAPIWEKAFPLGLLCAVCHAQVKPTAARFAPIHP